MNLDVPWVAEAFHTWAISMDTGAPASAPVMMAPWPLLAMAVLEPLTGPLAISIKPRRLFSNFRPAFPPPNNAWLELPTATLAVLELPPDAAMAAPLPNNAIAAKAIMDFFMINFLFKRLDMVEKTCFLRKTSKKT